MYHTRLFAKAALITVMVCGINLYLPVSKGWSHECIPASNSAADIFAYNSCKSDLLTGTSGHDTADNTNSDAARIEALEQENAMLRTEIKTMKARLLQIIADY
jgi:hypothetical protein